MPLKRITKQCVHPISNHRSSHSGSESDTLQNMLALLMHHQGNNQGNNQGTVRDVLSPTYRLYGGGGGASDSMSYTIGIVDKDDAKWNATGGGGASDSMSYTIGIVDKDDAKWNATGGGRKKQTKKQTKTKASRPGSKSSNIHDAVLEKLNTLMDNENDARAIKAGLYSMVKENDKESKLSNLERAEQMQELLSNKSVMNTLKKNINNLRTIIKTADNDREQRKSLRSENINNNASKKTKKKGNSENL